MDSPGPWTTERGCSHYGLKLSWLHWRWPQFKSPYIGSMRRLWGLQPALLEPLFLAFYICFLLAIHTFEIDCNFSVWSIILCSLGGVLCTVLCSKQACWRFGEYYIMSFSTVLDNVKLSWITWKKMTVIINYHHTKLSCVQINQLPISARLQEECHKLSAALCRSLSGILNKRSNF